VADGVVDDVLDRRVVLLFGLDHFRPEAPPEDVVLALVPLVERARVLTVEVAHAVREVRQRRLDEEVVVVAEQAPGVEAPPVPPPDAPQDLKEDRTVPVVREDRRVVVPFRPDVVVGAGLEITERTSHVADGSPRRAARTAAARIATHSRCRHVTCQARDAGLGAAAEREGSRRTPLPR
jgi:hypothetical protein